MSTRARALVLCFLVWVPVILIGCGIGKHHGGGGGSTQTTPLSVTTSSLPDGTVGSAYSATLVATGGTSPYSWTLASSSQLPAGLTLSSSGQITGTPTASGASSFTVSVSDSASSADTASANLSITVNAAPLSVTTTGLPGGTLGTAYSASLAATGGVPPYSWTWTAASGSQLPAGLTLASSGPITGTPTASGSFSFAVTVSDSASPANTATANLVIVVAATSACSTMGGESMLSGQYAFVLTGFDNGQGTGETQPEPALVGGVLTFNGSGTITAGAIDMNLNSGPQTNLALTSGSYGVGSDQRGCMVITTSNGTQNYRLSLGFVTSSGVATIVHVVDFDLSGPFVVGTMRQQTSSAFGIGTGQITGNYAFGISSPQNSAIGGKFGAAGVFLLSGVNSDSAEIGGELDMNLNGELDGMNTNWPSTGLSINGGGSLSVSRTGRGTISFTPTVGSTLNGIVYVVSSSEMLAISADPQTSMNIWAGQLMQCSGTISGDPLSGMYVGYDSGLGSSTAKTDILLFGPFTSGAANFPFTQLRNDSGAFTSQTVSAASATYSVDLMGRTTVTAAGSNHLPVLYLVSPSAAFLLGSNGGVDSGYVQSQTSVSAPSAIYAFGDVDPQISGSTLKSGVADFTSSNITIIADENNSSGVLALGDTQGPTATSVDSTGLGSIPSGCTISASSTTCQYLFYVISPDEAVLLDTTSTAPKLTIADVVSE